MDSETLRRSLGQRVLELRRERGWTQRDLAREAGLSVRFLGQLESGQANVSVGRLVDVALALEVSLVTLFSGFGPTPDVPDRLADYARERGPEAGEALWARVTGHASDKLALIGLRGAGKSTIGTRVAEATEAHFVVVDDLVRARAGMRLADVFEMHGALGYHRLCHDVLAEVLQSPGPAVLEIGGSVVADDASWQLLSRSATVVWLRASAEAHLERVAAQGDLRPMAGFDDALLRVNQILAERQPLYERAHWVIDTEALGLEGAVASIAERMKTVAST